MKTFLTIVCLLIFISSCKKNESGIKPSATIVFYDQLKTPKNNWFTGSTAEYEYKFDQGAYSIKVIPSYYFYYATLPYKPINYAYSVQVDAKIQLDDVNKKGAIGLIFNRTDETHYSTLVVTSYGTYYIVNRVNDSYSTVAYQTSSPIIRQGNNAKNTIAINQNENSVDVIVNNIKIGSHALLLPTSFFTVGPFAYTFSGSDYTPTTGLFNNFILTKQ